MGSVRGGEGGLVQGHMSPAGKNSEPIRANETVMRVNYIAGQGYPCKT